MSPLDPAVDFDAATALVVVDVQNDFADPRGGLYVAGGEQIIATLNELIDAARAAGATVVYTQDWHPPSTPHFQKDGGIWPVHCVGDSWGAEFHPDLHVDGPIIHKGTAGEDGYSGFTARDVSTGRELPTDLEALLHDRGVRHLVIVGLALDYCVKETALDARRLGFDAVVPLMATRAVNLEAGDDRHAIAAMVEAGATVR